jgi:2-C-methyl-D-erythritol 4-phosphate cytidylyltransferase
MPIERPRGAADPDPAGVFIGPRVHAIVPAAGRGERFGGATVKQFVSIAGRPLLAWTLDRLLAAGVGSVVVALPEDELESVRPRLSSDPRIRFVVGGSTRQASVAAALEASPAEPDELVAVHDGVRAAIDLGDLERTFAAALLAGGAVLGRPMTDTVKRVEGSRIVETVDRRELFLAETPQVFRRSLLERALDAARRDRFVGTDEASLVERLGEDERGGIAAVVAERPNPKLTYDSELSLFERLLRGESEP